MQLLCITHIGVSSPVGRKISLRMKPGSSKHVGDKRN